MNLPSLPPLFLDHKGEPIPLGSLKLGQTVYRRVNGELVSSKLVALNPLRTE
jgi:hypothetical protein